MRFCTLSSLALGALTTSLASAQNYTTSAPFALSIQSTNATYNGGSLYACHEGAAIEGLCFSKDAASSVAKTFAFNTTEYSQGFGNLVYNFTFNGGAESLWVPASLTYNIASNVAVPLFSPGYGSNQFNFTRDDETLVMGSYISDTGPDGPKPGSGNTAYSRWYICKTYAGYSYTTLAWVMGTGEPQNPTCVKVEVKRVF